jgi:cyclophilin family peptidyl-prolyl cis-trans isomerase
MHTADTHFEPLESRIVLDSSPFPAIEALDNPLHPVVRIQTMLGAIDVELFESGATEQTARSFRELLQSGAYGETFFHRAQPNFVLGAGRFRFDDMAGLTQREGTVPVEPLAIPSNIEGTLAMPVPALTIPQSRGDFIINLANNAPLLDGSWLVFGRVVQGWNIVQQIAALPTTDFSETIVGPGADQLTQVPLLDGEPGAITQDRLVTLADAQIVKPLGLESFYQHRIYYPEGYSWERILQSLELVNPNAVAADYQVIIRYEVGQRDQVIAEGRLAPNARTSLVVSPELVPSELVRENTPYAYEVWSTIPIAADLRHRDFGRPTRESFFNPAALPSEDHMLEWTFTQTAFGEGGAGPSNVFILWQNTSEFAGEVAVTFYFQDAEPVTTFFDLGPYRRGGINLLDVQGLPVAQPFTGARIASDLPIVASLSRFDRRPGAPAELEGGVMTLGTFGGGSTVGVAPAARRGPADALGILNTTSEDVVISFIMTPRPGTPVTLEVVLPANRFTVLAGQNSPAALVPPGREYTITYSATAPVTAGFITTAFRGTGTGFATWAAQEIHFADASVYIAPQGSPFGATAVSIFNPAGTQTADVQLAFRFDTGPLVDTLPGTWLVGAGLTQERRINEFNARISQIRGGVADLTARSPYSLEILSTVPVVAQARLLQGEGRTELGMPLSPIVLLGETVI